MATEGDSLILEAAETLEADFFAQFVFRYFNPGTPMTVIASIVHHWADLLRPRFPWHGMSLLHQTLHLVHQHADPEIRTELETRLRQHLALVEGAYAAASVSAGVRQSFAPGDWIDDRVLVYYGLHGGMGEVYFGYDDRDDRFCVAKLPLQEGVNADFFLDEGTAWLSLSGHPNLVDVYFVGNHGPRPYLLMELVPGVQASRASLRQLLNRSLTLAEILDYALQFCDGMCWAAAKIAGIVHRDIKPENILISFTKTLKITDWGLVRAELPRDSDLVVSVAGSPEIRIPPSRQRIPEDAHVGTVLYMPPEQLVSGAVSVESDIYSFGCVLYEMIAGRTPFASTSFAETVTGHLRREPEPLARLRRDTPPELAALVHRCLEKAQSERFPTFEALASALEPIYRRMHGGSWMPKPFPRESAYTCIQRCIGLSHAGKQSAALEAIDRVLSDHPSDSFALFTRANILKELNRYAEAIAILRELSRADEVEPSVWYNLGVMLFASQEEEEAKKCLETAATLGHPSARRVLDDFNRGGVFILT